MFFLSRLNYQFLFFDRDECIRLCFFANIFQIIDMKAQLLLYLDVFTNFLL